MQTIPEDALRKALDAIGYRLQALHTEPYEKKGFWKAFPVIPRPPFQAPLPARRVPECQKKNATACHLAWM